MDEKRRREDDFDGTTRQTRARENGTTEAARHCLSSAREPGERQAENNPFIVENSVKFQNELSLGACIATFKFLLKSLHRK